MVNEWQDSAREAERALALRYAPARRRAALAVLFDLDARLGAITRAARDPTIGLMRLTWWGDALSALDRAPAPAEPLLRALAATVLPLRVSGARLERMVDAWARHLEPEAIDLALYAYERGETLFAAAADLLGGVDPRVGELGRGCALAELTREAPPKADPGEARERARELLARCYRQPWPLALRALGALGLLASSDVDGRVAPGDPRRTGRLLWHRLTGR